MKCKIVFLVMSSLLINVSYGMLRRAPGTMRRAPVVRARAECPRRSLSYKVEKEIVTLKVVPPDQLKTEVETVLARLSNDEKRDFKELNACIKENAFNGENDASRKLLNDKTRVQRSVILDQVDMIRERSLLIKAANIGDLTFMDFLLQYRANAAITDYAGDTALTINPLRLTPELVEKLLINGAEYRDEDGFRRNVLHKLAMRPNNVGLHYFFSPAEDYSAYEEINGEVARKLISDHGPSMYGKDVWGETPIDIALRTKHVAVLKAFIDCGADRKWIIERASDGVKQDLLAYYKVY